MALNIRNFGKNMNFAIIDGTANLGKTVKLCLP